MSSVIISTLLTLITFFGISFLAQSKAASRKKQDKEYRLEKDEFLSIERRQSKKGDKEYSQKKDEFLSRKRRQSKKTR